jgi:mannose-6-phosphate isomerase-like protein (cupin superfamily)
MPLIMNVQSFAAFEAEAMAAGFDEVLERTWEADLVLDMHSHRFDVEAVVVRGEMWLTCDGKTRHLTPGQGFALACDVPHSERYGPQGATNWIARRHVAGTAI